MAMTLEATGNMSVIFGSTDNITLNDTVTERIPEVPNALQIVIMYTVATGAFLLNLTVFYTVPRLHKKINSSTRYGMLNLALTDALLGFSLLVGRIIYLIDPALFLQHLCLADGLLNPLLAIMSAFGLVFLNLDKFLALKSPFGYKVWMTRRKTIITLVGIWLAFLALYIFALVRGHLKVRYFENAFICFVYYPTKTTSSFVALVIRFILLQAMPFCICLVAVIGMYRILKNHKKQASALQEGQQTVSKNDHAVVYTIFALNFLYFVMITPFFVCVSVWKLVTGSTLGADANFIAVWLAACNSVINPLIYIPSMRSYRRELKLGFRRLFSAWSCREKDYLQSSTSKGLSSSSAKQNSDTNSTRL